MLKTIVKKGSYHDSVVLMLLTNQISTIEGVKKFTGARVSAPDLRAGAALCIAGLATDGITIVDDIVYIQRGYERFEDKLRGIGGIIEKVETEKDIQKFKLKVS